MPASATLAGMCASPVPSLPPDAAEVLGYWRAAGPDRWFRKDAGFDAGFRSRFLALHEAAARGELADWAEHAEGGLALLILLDQFPRNAFRGEARVYATDPQARGIARRMVERGHDQRIEPALRSFVYLPFSHSESLDDQDLAVALQSALGGDSAWHAQGHREIVRRFGHFPHRNAMLGRSTTEDERRFLDAGGFAG